MGRYDGEDYDERPPCRYDQHNFAMNGSCWKCGHSRQNLISDALGTIRLLAPEMTTLTVLSGDDPTYKEWTP